MPKNPKYKVKITITNITTKETAEKTANFVLEKLKEHGAKATAQIQKQ